VASDPSIEISTVRGAAQSAYQIQEVGHSTGVMRFAANIKTSIGRTLDNRGSVRSEAAPASTSPGNITPHQDLPWGLMESPMNPPSTYCCPYYSLQELKSQPCFAGFVRRPSGFSKDTEILAAFPVAKRFQEIMVA